MYSERNKLISVRVNSELYNAAITHIKNNKWRAWRDNQPKSVADILTKGLKDYLDSA